MPTYIILHELSQENLENMESERAAGIERLEALGGELQGLWLTFGQYDAVGIVDFPNDEAALEWLLTQTQATGLSTETLKAIPADQAEDILGGG